jgi:hypothetical protein
MITFWQFIEALLLLWIALHYAEYEITKASEK